MTLSPDNKISENANLYLTQIFYLITWCIKKIYIEDTHFISTRDLYNFYVRDFSKNMNLFSLLSFSKELPKALATLNIIPGRARRNNERGFVGITYKILSRYD